MAASVAHGRWRLRLALRAVEWTGDSDVKMFVVSPPWPHLGQPRPIRPGLPAHGLFDCRIYEDAGDDRVLRSSADNSSAFMRPHFWIDLGPVLCNHVQCHFELAFLW